MLKDKTVLRNTIAVIVGLAVIYAIIQFGLIYNADRLGWDDKVFPEWRHIIKYFSHQEGKKFEVQFFGVALGDVLFTPYHPTWYEIAICPVLFFSSWIGGLIVDLIYKKFFKKYKPSSQSY